MKKKVYENKVLYCKALRCETIKNNKKLLSLMSNLQNYYHFKLDFQKSGPTSWTYRGQVVDPCHQTPQGQSVAKPETPL